MPDKALKDHIRSLGEPPAGPVFGDDVELSNDEIAEFRAAVRDDADLYREHGDGRETNDRVARAAIDQNDAMRQQLAHIGNLVSDLERAMRVDPANEDGSWPDLAGRVSKLIAATHPTDAPKAGGDAVPEGMVLVPVEPLEKLGRLLRRQENDDVAEGGHCIKEWLAALTPHEPGQGEAR